jgi:hypothetical protein
MVVWDAVAVAVAVRSLARLRVLAAKVALD